MRDITSAVQSVTEDSVVEPFMLAELLFDGDPVRVWTGVGELSWDGKDWTGVGELGSVEPVDESDELTVNGLSMSFSAIPSEWLSLALSQPYRGRLARLYMGFFGTQETTSDPDGALVAHDGTNLVITSEDGQTITERTVIADPFVLWEGRMDQMAIEEGGETSEVTVRAESRIVDLTRPRAFLYDNEDQQSLYPGDRGFEFVAGLQDKEIAWGVGVSGGNAPRLIRNDDISSWPGP